MGPDRSGVDLTAEHDTFYAKSITTPQASPMSNSSIRAFSKYLANQGTQSDTVRHPTSDTIKFPQPEKIFNEQLNL
jgi:hypothetical protein